MGVELLATQAMITELVSPTAAVPIANGTPTAAPFADALKIVRGVNSLAVMPALVVLGTITNSLNILVLTHKSMRTSTYLYLAALAVSDMLQLVFNLVSGLGFLSKHISSYYLCTSEIYSFLRYFSIYINTGFMSTSASIVTTFTVERYIAVCHPMKAKVFCTRRKCVLLISLCYVWNMAITVPQILSDRGVVLNGDCYRITWIRAIHDKVTAMHYTLIQLCVGSILPFILIVVFNALLIRTVVAAGRNREQMIRGQAIVARKTRHRSSLLTSSGVVGGISTPNRTPTRAPPRPGGSRRTTRMLVIVCVVFLLTRIPMALLVFNYELINAKRIEEKKALTFYYMFELHPNLMFIFNNVGNFFSILNASSNFILYSFLSEKFRETFKEIFLKLMARCTGRKFVVPHVVGRTMRSDAESTVPLNNNNNNLLSPPIRVNRSRRTSNASGIGNEMLLKSPPAHIAHNGSRKSPDNRSVSSLRSVDSRL